jgi:G3E family GTPase
MQICGSGAIAPVIAKVYKPDHVHDETVSSVGITIPGDVDNRKLNTWLRDLLMSKGTDIYRMKGVLSIKGEDERFVFQGVHMLFDGRPDRPWGKEPRHNSLIFIGKNLNRRELNEEFRKCLA